MYTAGHVRQHQLILLLSWCWKPAAANAVILDAAVVDDIAVAIHSCMCSPRQLSVARHHVMSQSVGL